MKRANRVAGLCLALCVCLWACGEDEQEQGPGFPVLGADADARAFLTQEGRLHLELYSPNNEAFSSCEEERADPCSDNDIFLSASLQGRLSEGQVLAMDQFSYVSGLVCNNSIPFVVSEAEATVVTLNQERIAIRVEGRGADSYSAPGMDMPFSVTYTAAWCTAPGPWQPQP